MNVLKPNWVGHEHRVIYSVHIHPDGSRFATAGADKLVKVWNMRPVLDERAELDSSVPRLLSTLTVHTGAVNAVRWSRSGHLLASAGGDGTVLLWQLSDSSQSQQTPFGVDAPPCVENYRCAANLLGHSADVQDLAWSPDSKHLASCSIDNLIFIWNTDTFQRVATLSEHTNWVKGLAWDPINKFLASQSADGTMIIWRCSDWSVEKRFRRPFLEKQFVSNYASEMNRQIVFHRPHWSPDGNCLVGTYAHSKVFVSPVFSRGMWRSVISYVGHTKPTTVVRFCPTIFTTAGKGDDDPSQQFCVCAVGSMDSVITVWSTTSSKPCIILRHFFEQSVLDLSWSADGRCLLAVSHDGSLAVFEFGESAFGGRPLHSQEQTDIIHKTHGNVLAASGSLLLESAAALSLERTATTHAQSPPKASAPTLKSTPTPSRVGLRAVSASEIVAAQKETTNLNGRRRIAPVLQNASLSSAADVMTSRLGPPPADSTAAFPSATAPFDVPAPASAPAVAAEPLPPAAPTSVAVAAGLEAAPCKAHFSCTFRDANQSEEDASTLTLEVAVTNKQSQSFPSVSLVCLSGGSELLHHAQWRIEIPSEIVLGTISSTQIALASSDHSLYILGLSGRRLLPPLMLPAPPVSLSSRDQYVLCLCTDGSLSVLDTTLKRMSCRCNISALLSPRNRSVLSAALDAEGCPVLTMAPSAFVFIYSQSMESWMRIDDDHFVRSELATSLDLNIDHKSTLEALQNSSRTKTMVKAQNLFYVSDEQRVATTLGHVEHQMACAIALDSAEDYHRWIVVYVKQLVSNCTSTVKFPECRLRELLLDLAGPLPAEGSHDNSQYWKSTVCGISKRDLFQELLPLLGGNRTLQKLSAMLLEYSKELQSTTEDAE